MLALNVPNAILHVLLARTQQLLVLHVIPHLLINTSSDTHACKLAQRALKLICRQFNVSGALKDANFAIVETRLNVCNAIHLY